MIKNNSHENTTNNVIDVGEKDFGNAVIEASEKKLILFYYNFLDFLLFILLLFDFILDLRIPILVVSQKDRAFNKTFSLIFSLTKAPPPNEITE